ncbi:hypothetical protein [Amaricoccus sp.]|uniref:hypothetical protein n=1 Tax=Amaricoccus sp. TaxID=1872485 RepID=UPI00260A717F|nr:hypothetical protein [uncultured Amaricoccus sp.]
MSTKSRQTRAGIAAKILTAFLFALSSGAASAASFDDPDWPCIQRKVPTLSVGQMWPGPPPEGDWLADPELARLVDVVAARRTSLDEVKTLADAYAAKLPAEERPARMALLFAGVLDRIDVERAQIITGIGRYAHKQADVSTRVKAREAEIATLEAAPEPDLDKVEEMRDTLNWDIRVYRERAQALTYVCETPVLLEQRAFAIARILAAVS